MEYSKAHALAQEIRDSEEARAYHALREAVMADETQAALIREYHRLAVTLQMTAASGQQSSGDDMQRFSAISGLLFSKPEVNQYLLAEMRLQQAMADIFRILTEAADLDLGMEIG